MPLSPSGNKSKPRLAAELFGRRGETLAAWYLRLKGYRIIATRYKTPIGEIDLVARRFGVTVFVEVKARQRRDSLADALSAVNTRRITRAAQFFMTRQQTLASSDMRFDVIFLAPLSWPRHVRNAFDAS
jgi:putative endonuclease